jgi:hypothetical protein
LPRAHWAMWALLCFLFFGEETSWLQHWAGYATPDSIRAMNVQSEFNLHNLQALSPDDRVFSATGAAFTWKHLLSSQHLFNLGFVMYFLLLPLLMLIQPVKALAHRLGVPKLSRRFLLMVWNPLVASVVLTVANRGDEGSKGLIGETREMFFALTILWFTASAYRYVRAQKNTDAAARLANGAARA